MYRFSMDLVLLAVACFRGRAKFSWHFHKTAALRSQMTASQTDVSGGVCWRSAGIQKLNDCLRPKAGIRVLRILAAKPPL